MKDAEAIIIGAGATGVACADGSVFGPRRRPRLMFVEGPSDTVRVSCHGLALG